MPEKEAATGRRLPEPGEVLAKKYRIERRLGKGGMGAVYLAHHELLHQPVAIKFLLPDLAAQPEIAARFLNEARASARIRDEHAVIVHDVDTLEDGNAFMVLEYLEGSDLSSLLTRQGPLPIEEALSYTLQALQAVARAHTLGIVHRDLKPANLFLSLRPDGSSVVKVLDFGISKMVASDPLAAELSKTGSTLGTLGYMPPEQIRDAKSVDERADIWAMGVILYLLLTGKAPFRGGDTELVAAILEQTPAPMGTLRAEVPPQLDLIVARCLKKSREERYKNVLELAEALGPLAPADAKPCIDRIRKILAGRPLMPVATPPQKGPVTVTAPDRVHNRVEETLPPPPAPVVPAPPGVPPPAEIAPGLVAAPALPKKKSVLPGLAAAVVAVGAIGAALYFAGYDPSSVKRLFTGEPVEVPAVDGVAAATADASAPTAVPGKVEPAAAPTRKVLQLWSATPGKGCGLDLKWLEDRLESARQDDASVLAAVDALWTKRIALDECFLAASDRAEGLRTDKQKAATLAVFNRLWQTQLCQIQLRAKAATSVVPEFKKLHDYLLENKSGVSASADEEIFAAADMYARDFLFAVVSHGEGAARYREELEQVGGAREQLKRLQLRGAIDSETILAAALYLRRWGGAPTEGGKPRRQSEIGLWKATNRRPSGEQVPEKAEAAAKALHDFFATGAAANREEFTRLWKAYGGDDEFYERVVRTIKASHRLLFEAVTDSLVEGPAVKAKEEGLEVDRLLGAVQDYYDETSKDQPDRGRLGTAYGDSFLFVMDSVHRGLGRFSVGSTPAAQILVDGKDTGRWTPVTAAEPIEVPVGDHTLVLRTADRRTVTKKLTVAADEATTLETVSDFK